MLVQAHRMGLYVGGGRQPGYCLGRGGVYAAWSLASTVPCKTPVLHCQPKQTEAPPPREELEKNVLRKIFLLKHTGDLNNIWSA